MNPEPSRRVKILAVKKDTQVYKILEEAIIDFLKKHKKLMRRDAYKCTMCVWYLVMVR